MSTQEQVYLDAQKACGLKVGDWVRVTRKAENGECGWDDVWLGEMDQTINSIGEIRAIRYGSIVVFFDKPIENFWRYPYFVLEKVEKPKCEFKPFDRVLVRDGAGHVWRPDIFSMYRESDFPYHCLSSYYAYCIPYEGNEHLAGTTRGPE